MRLFIKFVLFLVASLNITPALYVLNLLGITSVFVVVVSMFACKTKVGTNEQTGDIESAIVK